MRGSKIGQASMLKSIFYVEVCYSISSIVDHVKKPNCKLLRYCIIDINKCYTPGMFLVYRHTSVFLLDCIWAFLFSWMGFPLSLPEWTVFFFYIYTLSHHYAVLSLFSRLIPFYFPPWTLMPKNVSFYSNAVANIFLDNGCIVTFNSGGVPCNVCYDFFFF